MTSDTSITYPSVGHAGSSYVVIVIPVFNEHGTISDVVVESLKYGHVVVVDDGSSDNSGDIASRSGAIVLRQSNQGVGKALRAGTSFVLERLSNIDVIVFIDGDGQHNPYDIPRLVQRVWDGCDMALGTRSLGIMDTPLPRWAGNKILGVVRNAGAKCSIKDAECGFRAFSRKAVEALAFSTDGFGVCEEVAIKARAKGLRIAQVPVAVSYSTEQSKYPAWVKAKHLAEIAYTILKWRWRYEWKRNGTK